MDDRAVEDAAALPEPPRASRKPYTAPRLTSYGSLQVDTTGLGGLGIADLPFYATS